MSDERDSREDAFHDFGSGFDKNTVHLAVDKSKALNVPLVQTPGMSNEHYNVLKAEEDHQNRT